MAKNNSKKVSKTKKASKKRKKMKKSVQTVKRQIPKKNLDNAKKEALNKPNALTKKSEKVSTQKNKSNKKVKSKNKFIKNLKNKLKKHTQKFNKFIILKKKRIIKKRLNNINEKAKKKEEILTKNQKFKEINPPKELKSINIKLILSLLIIMIASILLFVLFKKDTQEKIELEKINLEEYLSLYNNKNLSYIYISDDNCTYCSLIEPSIDRLEKDYKIVIKKLNYGDLNEKNRKLLEESNSVFEEGWKAPILISIKEGKEISSVKGYKEYSVLKRFVEYSNNPKEANTFTKISIDKYLSIIKSKDLSIVYIGRNKSSGCEIYVPILESVSQEKKLNVYYLDTDSLDTENEWNKLNNSNEIFKDTWFMPATLIIKDGEIVDYKFETMDKGSLEYFLSKNGV